MEKGNRYTHLFANSFKILLDTVFKKLEEQFPGILKRGITQIFGFGNYDPHQPSLKGELEKLSGNYINGKYLYDKQREVRSGKPHVRINNPYNHLLLQYLDYDSYSQFVHNHIADEQEKKKQLSLIESAYKVRTHYYVSYHFGEYRKIVKAQVIVRDDWKSIEYKYMYPTEKGDFEEFLYFGNIKKRADALHIQTRTLMDGKMVEGGENILYIGYGDPAKSKFILGVYSAFDINNRLIAGKIIHQKCASKEEMLRLSQQKKIPGYIAQEIRNMRIENEINIPNDKLEISSKSPYYLSYEGIAGEYLFSFPDQDEHLTDLSIHIDPDTFKISSDQPGILINKDHIELMQNGSVLYFRFDFTGLTSFSHLNIYVKTYYLRKATEMITGAYSGIDFENRLRQGETLISFRPALVL